LAVIPTYLLARDPAVILPSMRELELVLVPRRVRWGRGSSSGIGTVVRALKAEETTRDPARLGVVVVGLEWESRDGVARPLREKDALDDARDRWEDATDAGREGPEVRGAIFVARTNMPQFGGQEKYSTLHLLSAKHAKQLLILTHLHSHHSSPFPRNLLGTPPQPNIHL
jgi:hypothetical protein